MQKTKYQDGLLLFSKYAFSPNMLRYCGPQDSKMFVEILKDYPRASLSAKKELSHLSLQFEGAVPYLKLIAQANDIKDIFDFRVVEAYWLGNNLLGNVKGVSLYSHIEERFKKKMAFKNWQSMKDSSILANAKPFHNFHVFNIYSQTGLMRSGARGAILSTMDNCKINWGKVREISAGNAIIEYRPLEFDEFENLKLGEKTVRNFYTLDDSIKKGNEVSLHWNFICDKLTPSQKRNLIYWTNYHIGVFNALNAPSR